MDALTVFLGIVSVVGTAGTFYFGFKSFSLERARNSFTWNDVETAAVDVLKRGEKMIEPDILLMMSGAGSIVTSLAMVKAGRYYPVYLAMLEVKKGLQFRAKPKGYTETSTKKWNVYMPDILCGETDKKIMIIDDCVMSGDLQTAVRQFLESRGFAPENIIFGSLVCSKIASLSQKSPDVYYHLNPHGEFYFPWGSWF